MQESVDFTFETSVESFEAITAAVPGWPALTALSLCIDGLSREDVDSSVQKLAHALKYCNALQAFTAVSCHISEPAKPSNALLPPICLHHAGLQHLDLGRVDAPDAAKLSRLASLKRRA